MSLWSSNTRIKELRDGEPLSTRATTPETKRRPRPSDLLQRIRDYDPQAAAQRRRDALLSPKRSDRIVSLQGPPCSVGV